MTEHQRYRAMADAMVSMHNRAEELRKSLQLSDMDMIWVISQVVVGKIGVMRDAEIMNRTSSSGKINEILEHGDGS